ncbi:MAG: SDR family oxidoreductase [Eubacteriales bacterium]|nr:SDR family oxidoreductase [Eubacteriales bacterium]
MKRILITDVTSKVGQASAELFLKRGWIVVGFGRKPIGDRLLELGIKYNKVFFCMEGDVSKEEEIDKLEAFVIECAGGVDAIFNNAEVALFGQLHLTDESAWDEIFSVNLRSILLTTRTFLPYMMENGGGAIVNNASLSGLQGEYNMAAYCAAMGGVADLTRAMALDYGEYKIRVNGICAGAECITDLFDYDDERLVLFANANPMHKVGTPMECAKCVYFLASDESTHCSGVLLPVSGAVDVQTGGPRNEGL